MAPGGTLYGATDFRSFQAWDLSKIDPFPRRLNFLIFYTVRRAADAPGQTARGLGCLTLQAEGAGAAGPMPPGGAGTNSERPPRAPHRRGASSCLRKGDTLVAKDY